MRRVSSDAQYESLVAAGVTGTLDDLKAAE